MDTKTNKHRFLRAARRIRTPLSILLLGGVLAACGGGGGGGGGGGPPPPQPCQSQTSQGTGFALGSCAATLTNVFQPIEATVNVISVTSNAESYTLALDFPAALQSLDSNTIFGAGNRPPDSVRNIIGILRGQAFENPFNPTLTAPYVAITEFFQSWDFQAPAAAPPRRVLSHVNFGTWEKVTGSGTTEAAFNEAYFGAWFSPRTAGTTVNTWPTDPPATYTGEVVGIIGPDGSSSTPVLFGGRFGFSAPITISVDGNGITTGTIGQITVTFQTQANADLSRQDLNIKPIAFSTSLGASPGTMTGTLTTGAGAGAGVVAGTGVYEARHFGIAGQFGIEIGGRVRFRTDDGSIAVGAFGARR